jgi:hypothetical protein
MANDRSTTGWAAAGWNGDGEHPAARFEADCALQLDVCKSLLAVADRLPEAINAQTLAVLSVLVPTTWTSHLTLQGEAILPLIARRHEESVSFQSRFQPLARQHIEISGINDEIVECFGMLERGETVETGMFGYLIRNAAERRREHIDWERVLLGPLLPQNLTPIERQTYLAWASAHPWPYDDFKARSMTRSD